MELNPSLENDSHKIGSGGHLVILRPAGSDEGGSKLDDRLFSHWRSKQLEPDYAELTNSIDVRAQRNKRPAKDRLKF
jgi:hypothetical protein